MGSDLEGATTEGDPRCYANTPGEFAARWNSWDENRRMDFLRFVQQASDKAQVCTMTHDGRRWVPTYAG